MLKFSEVYFNVLGMTRSGTGQLRSRSSSSRPWRPSFSNEEIGTFSITLNYLFLFCVQVFDVVINGDVTVAADLDIYDKVGRGSAHDEVIQFQAKGTKLLFQDAESELTRGKMRVEFIKVRYGFEI